MADKAISELPADGQAEATDILVVVDGSTGTTRKLTVSQLETYLSTVLTGGSAIPESATAPTGGELLWADTTDVNNPILKILGNDGVYDTISGGVGTAPNEIKVGGTEPATGEENFWLDNGVFKVRQSDDSFLAAGSTLSVEDQAKLDALIEDAPVILTTAPATTGDVSGLSNGDLVEDSNGVEYIVATQDGVLTPYTLNEAGVIEVGEDPNNLGTITGLPTGQLVADTSGVTDVMYYFDESAGDFVPLSSSEIHRGTRATAPTGTKLVIEDDGSMYADLDNDGDFTDETALSGGSSDGSTPATATVTIPTGTTPDSSTVGEEGEMINAGGTCYLMSDLTAGSNTLSVELSTAYSESAVDNSGNIFARISSGSYSAVHKLNSAGTSISSVTMSSLVRSVLVDLDTDNVFVVEDDKVSMYDNNLVFLGDIVLPSSNKSASFAKGNIVVVAKNATEKHVIDFSNPSSPSYVDLNYNKSNVHAKPFIDNFGNLYIANTRSISPYTSISETYSGLSILTNSGSYGVSIIGVIGDDIFYIEQGIKKYNKITDSTTTIHATTGTESFFQGTINSSYIYVNDVANDLVKVFNHSGVFIENLTQSGGVSGSNYQNDFSASDAGVCVSAYDIPNIAIYITSPSTYTWDTITCPSTTPLILSNGDFTLDGGSLPDIATPTEGQTVIDDTDTANIIVWRWDGTEWVDVTSISDTSYTEATSGSTGLDESGVLDLFIYKTSGTINDIVQSPPSPKFVSNNARELIRDLTVGLSGTVYIDLVATGTSSSEGVTEYFLNDILISSEIGNGIIYQTVSRGDNIKAYYTANAGDVSSVWCEIKANIGISSSVDNIT